MARIPVIRERSVRQAGVQSQGISPNVPQDAMGVDLSGAANQLTEVAMRAQDRANTAQVMEADSQLTDFENTALYDPENGAFNVRGRNSFGLPEEVMSRFDQRAQEIRQNLRGPQVDAFDKLYQQRRSHIDRALLRHVSGEMANYEQAQADALIAGSQVTASNYYNDPERIDMELRRQRGAVLSRAQAMGWAPEQTQLALRETESATHGAVIDRMAANDPQGAMRYYAKHGPEMTPEARIRYDRVVNDMRNRHTADRVVGSITAGNGVGADGVWGRMKQQESGGNQFDADGNPLTSSAGAIGVAQVMLDTGPEAARLAGVPWDEERFQYDAEYNETLGRAYFDSQMEKYGDPMLAAAAYNAGPGNVDAWLSDIGDPRNGEISREEFVRRIPFAETQGYVMNVAPPGAVEPEQLPRSQQMALLNGLPPEVRDIASDRLEAIWAVEDQRLQEIYADAQLAVEGGTSFHDLDTGVIDTLTADQIKALRARSRELATGEPVMNWQRWTELSSMSREELAAIEDPYTALRPHLDDSHYNKALNLINDAKGIGEDINTSSTLTFNQRVKNAAMQSGIVPADKTPARYSEDEALTFARFQGEASLRIENAERQVGRKLTGNEQQEVIDEMLTERIMLTGSGLGPDFLHGDTETFTWALDEDEAGNAYVPVESIPPAEAEELRNRMLSNGVVPSNDAIQRAWAQILIGDADTLIAILQGEM